MKMLVTLNLNYSHFFSPIQDKKCKFKFFDKLQFRNSFFHVKSKYLKSGKTAEKVRKPSSIYPEILAFLI